MERRAIDNLSRKFRAAKAAQSLDLERVQRIVLEVRGT